MQRSSSDPQAVFMSAWAHIYARIRALHSLNPFIWDPIKHSGKVKLSPEQQPYPDVGDFASSSLADAWRVHHLIALEAAYKTLLASCCERPVLFVHVIQARTEGVAGACVRLFLHVYNKVAVEAEARANDSSIGCFCMRRFTGREIAANEHDCLGSDFIILPGQIGNVSSQPSHPFFHTSMLFPFVGLDDKITFDLHNNLCCVPWGWQAVNHVTAFASKGVRVHKLARKQDDAGITMQDPNAAAAAALKGLQDAAAGGAVAATIDPRDSVTTWGLGLVEYVPTPNNKTAFVY